ncbi:MAG: hypothetical protein K6W08_16260, partial [Firmicutes bacterium]|nr:hypothetical protein [Bacillota bacterium]
MGADRVAAGSMAAPRPGPRRLRLSITAWRFIAFLLILAAWHVASIPAGKLLLPSPIDVAPAIVQL